MVAGEIVDAIDAEACAVGRRMQARRIGQLEGLVGRAGDQRQAVVVIERVFVIAEAEQLLRAVVQRRRHVVRRFDAQLRLHDVERAEEGVVGLRAAVVEARLDLAVTAAVQRRRAAGLQSRTRGHVDDRRRAQAVFGRKRAGIHFDALGELGAQHLAEA